MGWCSCGRLFLILLPCIYIANAEPLPSWFVEGHQSSLASGRTLKDGAVHCGPLTKELVNTYAKDNTVLVTVLDKIVWRVFGPSYVENVQAANITYWLIAALDPETSLALGAQGVKQCFNAPQDRLKYQSRDSNNPYAWGSHHWTQTTWNKVHVMRSVYELGVHIVHADADVVWFNDPLPFFHRFVEGPPHILITTDAVGTRNTKGDAGLEVDTHPHVNINTGVYFMRQWPLGLEFMDGWLKWQEQNRGHDQDGFNWHTRGHYFHGDAGMPLAVFAQEASMRLFYAAYHNTTAISFLPASMFGNTYTYVNARLWEKLDQPLYEVHWVWGGSTLESKRQNMRDAMKFHDEPEYYTEPYMVSFELDQMQMPEGFNDWPLERTEDMLRFHAAAANHQLMQTYFALGIALVTNRTLVMPRFLCYCSKNWYQTQSCRINHETATTFPFVCALSHLLRVKRLTTGGGFGLPGASDYSGNRVPIREYSFLDNPKVPEQTKRSRLEIVPSDLPRPVGAASPASPSELVVKEELLQLPGGAEVRRATVAAPLNDGDLAALMARYKDVRVLHFPQPLRTFSGFSRRETADAFDAEVQKRVTHWCCRTPPDSQALNVSDRIQLVALPPGRYRNLPPLDPRRANYLHELPPLPPWAPGRVLGGDAAAARRGALLGN